MIRYGPKTRAELEALVDAHNGGWRAKAEARTAKLVAEKGFSENSSIWGEIKPVFMGFQAFKCAFGERPLGGFVAGSGEHDVEHFRPKGKVRAWPYPTRKPKLSYSFQTGGKSDTGYYWLAYDLQNYAAACRPCNASRKSDYFPIAGARGKAAEPIASLNKTEAPFLLFPLGAHGDDPADFIAFEGILAVPTHNSGAKHDRARVTIDFFSLNDREELWADRFRTIRSLFYTLRSSQTDPDAEVRADALRALDEAVSDAAPQAACARAFLKVAQTDARQAWETYQAAEAFVRANAPKRTATVG